MAVVVISNPVEHERIHWCTQYLAEPSQKRGERERTPAELRAWGLLLYHYRVRATFPPKMGPIPPETRYFLCIVTCLNVSAMYLKCISSVVFGAFRRLVSLCIVSVSSVHSHVSLLCLVPSFMLRVLIHAVVSTFFNTGRYSVEYRCHTCIRCIASH